MRVLTRIQNFGGIAALKFGKAKNVQNFAQFKTPFDFDREYLWKGLRYQQAVNGVINYNFRVKQKKLDELWSTNHEIVFDHFNLPIINSARVFGQLFDFEHEYL